MTPCTVCDQPAQRTHRLVSGRRVAVCERVACTLAVTMPRPAFCAECDGVLPPERHAMGLCARMGCATKRQQRRIVADTVRLQTHRDRLELEAKHLFAADTIAVALVPKNTASTRPLGSVRRRRFEAHLWAMIAASHQAATAEEQRADHEARRAAHEVNDIPDEWQTLLGAACGTCRGWCCSRWAGDHAFIRAETIRETRAQQPQASDDDLAALYLSYLPKRSMHPGCVYQGSTGCTLPRHLRGTTCNRYLCDGLVDLLRQFNTGRARGIYLGHRDRQLEATRTRRMLPLLPV